MSGSAGPMTLDPATFMAFRSLLHQHAGIALGEHKLQMVQGRLGKRVRELALPHYRAYLELLQDPRGDEWVHFLNALTTNLTSFFRERHHFDRLPGLIPDCAAAARQIRVWSAGCSTGEESYSIAMTLLKAFPDWDIRVTATDLDTAVLARAASGVYPEARAEQLPLEWKRFGFQKGSGAQEGLVRVRPEIKRLVRFRAMNLLGGPWPRPEAFHVIFCRNVMIYFDKPTQRKLVGRFRNALVPLGILLVGHSESLLDTAHGLESLGQTIYRSPGGLP